MQHSRKVHRKLLFCEGYVLFTLKSFLFILFLNGHILVPCFHYFCLWEKGCQKTQTTGAYIEKIRIRVGGKTLPSHY